jgi:hypothetical protein
MVYLYSTYSPNKKKKKHHGIHRYYPNGIPMKRCSLRSEASAMALGIFDGHETKMLAVEAGDVVAEVLRMC